MPIDVFVSFQAEGAELPFPAVAKGNVELAAASVAGGSVKKDNIAFADREGHGSAGGDQ